MRPPASDLFAELRQIMIDRQDEWRSWAACKGLPVDWWFTERGDNESIDRVREICRACPVQTECFEYGVANSPKIGVYGGRSMSRASRERDRSVRFCAWCGNSYIMRTSNSVYCGATCRKARNRAVQAQKYQDSKWAS